MLADQKRASDIESLKVLILVLLEYARRQLKNEIKKRIFHVLILVLLEYARRPLINKTIVWRAPSLNPCFTGICSPTRVYFRYGERRLCLNPCFTGICSPTTMYITISIIGCLVLILVLLEYARRHKKRTNNTS